jgi:uncharacterized phage protein gp47/JayE
LAFGIPTREQIFAAFISDYASAQPAKNVSRGSDPYRLGRVVSGVVWTILAKLLYFIKQSLPDTAEKAFLDRWGAVYAFPRKQPVSSSGVNAVTVTGTIGNAVTNGAQLAHADGTLYTVTSVGAVVGAGGSVVVSVAASSTGLATNKGIGEVLTFTSPPTGIDAQATVAVALTGGLDLEDDAAYSVRLLAHIGDPPEGGAIHDYQEWALGISGVSAAYVWAHRRGAGTMDVAVLGAGTGAARVPSATVLAAVDDYIESVRPGNVRDFLVLTTTPVTQDVTMTVDIDDTVYKWDWNDAGVGYTVTAFDSVAKTITVPTAPASVIAGLRIQVRGEEARVTNRVGNVLTLSFDTDHEGNAVTWFTFTVSAGVDVIRASGDLVRPVRFAIMDLFNTLGPVRSTWSETSWIDQLKISKLYAAVTDVAGVDDANITTPVANVSPTADTFGDTVAFLVPGNIQVLKP